MRMITATATSIALALAASAFAYASTANAATYTDDHYEWCAAQHNQYSRDDNTYLAGNEQRKQCSSPYDENDVIVVNNPTTRDGMEMTDDMISQHVEWCNTRFPSYRAYDNTYMSGTNVRKACSSPYN